MAREARKKFSNMRIDLEKARKAIGEPAFRKYKAVNAVANYLLSLIKPIEDHLKEQEDFIKNDDARIEAEKKLEAERQAERDRIAKEEAERKEQERIRKENERLQREAEAREKIEAQVRAEKGNRKKYKDWQSHFDGLSLCGNAKLVKRKDYDPIRAVWCRNACGCNSEKWSGEVYYSESGEMVD